MIKKSIILLIFSALFLWFAKPSHATFDQCSLKCVETKQVCFPFVGCNTVCVDYDWVCPSNPDSSPSPDPSIDLLPSLDPSPQSSASATPVPLSEPPSGCRDNCEVHFTPPVCTKALPQKPRFTFYPVYPSSVVVNWFENDENTTHWSINYWYDKSDVLMGVPYLSLVSNSYPIQNLDLSRHVWLQLVRWNGPDCAVRSDPIDP